MFLGPPGDNIPSLKCNVRNAAVPVKGVFIRVCSSLATWPVPLGNSLRFEREQDRSLKYED